MHKLALRLGRTVEELQRSVTSKELTDWVAFDRISPIGDERGDVQAAMLASLIFNIKRGKSAAKKLIDFMPYITKKERAQTLSEQIKLAFKRQ